MEGNLSGVNLIAFVTFSSSPSQSACDQNTTNVFQYCGTLRFMRDIQGLEYCAFVNLHSFQK